MRIRVLRPGLLAGALATYLGAGCGLADLGAQVPLADPEPEAWGLAGQIALPSAARLMADRNGPGKPLAGSVRASLRPYFGDLVERVRVVWDAALIDQWSFGRHAVRPSDWGGQTYGERIYLAPAEIPGDAGQLPLLAHELVHARQTASLGGLEGFGYAYFKGYYLAGMSYEGNTFEREALALQERVAAETRRQTP